MFLGAAAACAMLLGVVGLSSYGQDVAKVSPKSIRVLLENDRVRVSEVIIAPGDSLLPHSHPDNFGYALVAGKVRVNYIGKESVDFEMKAGDVVWSDAEPPHTTVNIGTKEIRWIEVEMKEPAPKKPAPTGSGK